MQRELASEGVVGGERTEARNLRERRLISDEEI